jgi:hypothetical protein
MTNTPTPHQIAAEIAQEISAVIPFLSHKLKRCYDLANTAGKEQAIMDALKDLGIVPAQSLQVYAIMRKSLDDLGFAGDLPPENFQKFQPQPNGNVTVVLPEPPAPTPDPTPTPVQEAP